MSRTAPSFAFITVSAYNACAMRITPTSLTIYFFALLTAIAVSGCDREPVKGTAESIESSVAAVEKPKPSTTSEKEPPILTKAPRPTGERCFEKICFKDRLDFNGKEFDLLGMGKREYLWADIYTAAFYLPKNVTAYSKGVPQGAKIIVLEYQRTIEKQKIIDSINDNVVANPDADHVELRPRFDDFTDGFEPPHKGSRYYFVYEPGQGTALIKDGVTTVTIPGNDFADAFYGIWLHEATGNQSLRSALLGQQNKN